MLLTLFNIFLNDLFEVELVYNILLVSGVPHSDSRDFNLFLWGFFLFVFFQILFAIARYWYFGLFR